jgi:hypothetical protein
MEGKGKHGMQGLNVFPPISKHEFWTDLDGFQNIRVSKGRPRQKRQQSWVPKLKGVKKFFQILFGPMSVESALGKITPENYVEVLYEKARCTSCSAVFVLHDSTEMEMEGGIVAIPTWKSTCPECGKIVRL